MRKRTGFKNKIVLAVVMVLLGLSVVSKIMRMAGPPRGAVALTHKK